MRSTSSVLLMVCLMVWALPGLAAEVASDDGVMIHYDVQGAGEQALVFVHGWSCDRTYWRLQIPEFVDTHTVVTVDLAGHGDSGTGRDDWSIPAYAADVAAVVRDLGQEDVVLIGHSMSGPIVVEASALLAGRVRGVICVDTLHDVTFQYPAEQTEGFVASMRADFVSSTDGFVRSMFPESADPSLVDLVAADMSAAPPTIALATMSHVLTHDLKPTLSALDVPVRCLNATLWPFNIEANRGVYEDIVLVTMADVGHFLFLESPDTFNGKLAEILRELER
jgi:pimeloyl-ACP methyl ester carboxylesterase